MRLPGEWHQERDVGQEDGFLFGKSLSMLFFLFDLCVLA